MKKDKFIQSAITPDEIFLDAENMPGFDRRQFEGRVEKALKRGAFLSVAALFLAIGLVLFLKTAYLQVVKGAYFSERAENNHLRAVSLLPERGLIYDRNEELLAWNSSAFSLVLEKKNLNSDLSEFVKKEKNLTFEGLDKAKEDFTLGIFDDWREINDIRLRWPDLPLRIDAISTRFYKELSGLSHAVGYVGYGSHKDVIGKDGAERTFENILAGTTGVKIIELDSKNEMQSEFVQKNPVPGGNINLTIDSRVQNKLHEIISSVSSERGFQGGAAVILDVDSGEILTEVSFPEYNSRILSNGSPVEQVKNYIADSRKPFLNRAESGLYAPGSIIKPYMALAALNEKIISPQKQIFSSGSISIPNPYNPGEESVFLDWKAHGLVDMERAIAVSSNVYFYTIGGGYGDVAGLGIQRIKKYLNLFGFNTDTLSSPDSVWRIGDTYNISIGQGNLQITPMEAAVAVASVANEGYLVEPHMISAQKEKTAVDIPAEYFQIVKNGMRKCALEGTAQALGSLPVKIAAKTGTAELGSGKKLVNSWFTAFWPLEKPRYSISIVLEKGSASNLIGAVYAARQLFEWMIINTPEYLTSDF